MVFIPRYGINGAALATFLAVFLYNTGKLFFVYKKFKMLPFSKNTIKIAAVLILIVLLFYFWDFSYHPILNIIFKSVLITVIYGYFVYKYKFSENISEVIDKVIKRK